MLLITELEMERFNDVMIGNGFIGLLSEKSMLYTLDYSDNITLLYSKLDIRSIAISNNQLFAFCKDNKNDNKENTSYLCRWEPKSEKQSDEGPDVWTTFVYKLKEDFNNESFEFVSNKNREILLILQSNQLFNY